jgi:hypothetical protein
MAFDRRLTHLERRAVEAYLNAKFRQTVQDADSDGLPDWWESYYAVTAQTSASDGDGDGLTNREEYEDGTSPLVANAAVSVPEEALSLWLNANDLPASASGTALGGPWVSRVDGHLATGRMNGVNGPAAYTGKMNGHTAVRNTASAALIQQAAGDFLTPQANGGALFWAYRLDEGAIAAGAHNPQYCPFSQEVYHYMWNGSSWVNNPAANGYRAGLLYGRFALWSGQSLPLPYASAPVELWSPPSSVVAENTNYVVTFNYSGGSARSYLNVNGVAMAEQNDGLMINPTNQLSIGTGYWGEVMAFDRRLTHLERRAVEAYLNAKFRQAVQDADSDGLPDWWESYYGILALGGSANPDGDSRNNAAEYSAGKNPIVSD